VPEQALTTGRPIRLLDVDPDLGQDLEDAELLGRARAELVTRTIRLGWTRSRGHWGPRDPRGHLGLFVIEGLLLREVLLARGGSAELLGAGDLLRPWDVDGEELLPIPNEVKWTILSDVTLAVLDPDFANRVCRWPTVVARLISRNAVRAKANTLNQAISHFKHVESRLLLLFWHFAQRWGRVRSDVITIALPLTHEVLGKLVGATRPSVTTALGHLAERGLLVREDGIWHLNRESADRLHHPRSEPVDTSA
jgi:CRP/FNR family transcriptional regulator, cyclic AMP receptor protein